MKMNVGGIDKLLRIVIGVLLIVTSVIGLFTPWGFIGIVPLSTGLIGWCPAYTIFGINSCPLSRK